MVVVQSLSRVRLFVTSWTAACQASVSITNSPNLLKLMSIESVMPSNHLILCRSLLLPLQLSHHHSLFQWVSSSHQVAKVLELQLQHQSLPSVFRFDLLNYWLVWSPCCPRDYISIPQLIYCYCNTYLVFFHFWLKDVYEWNCYKSSPLNLDRMPKYFQMIFPTWMLTSMYKSAHSSTSFQQ